MSAERSDAIPAASAVSLHVGRAHKRFGAALALAGVDLDVPAGAFCVLLGPSGSGKTTLLRCVAGIERLDAGQIRIGGRLVADGAVHTSPDKRALSMVFQDYALWPHLSAERNVAFALGREGISKRAAVRRARDMLERVGLGALCERYPNELSGGEQQRVALARALVGRTGLVLFDEPLSNLDADLRERMRIEIGTLTRDVGATCVYITHDQAEAFALADTVGVLHDGRLVQLAPPETVYHRPASPFVARFTGLAGELPVEVAGPPSPSDDATTLPVRPAWAGGPSTTITATLPGAVAPNGPSTLLVRPAGVRLLAAGHPDRHLDGVVVDSAYRGRGYDHAVVVGEGIRLLGVHDARRRGRGQRVGVELLAESCLLFPPAERPAAVPAGRAPSGTGEAATATGRIDAHV